MYTEAQVRRIVVSREPCGHGILSARPRVLMVKPRIIAIGFDAFGTGLTRVLREILFPLGNDYEVHFLAIGYRGTRYEDRGVHIHPTNLEGGDVYAAFEARKMIINLDPAIVFALHDLRLLALYAKVFAPVRHRTRFVAYVPLDGALVDCKAAATLHGFDRVVSYTNWAREQLRDSLQSLGSPGSGRMWPVLDVIFHGVDLGQFHPSSELLTADFHHCGRAPLKRRLFPDLSDPEQSFIVLNANRPVRRKRLDLTIEGFARFAAGKPANVKLCLHLAHPDERTPQLLALASKYGIDDRLIHRPHSPDGGVISDVELNLLYGACDVGINTSGGEGWGLVSFEHAAAGGAQIVPRSTACATLWTDERAMMLDPIEHEVVRELRMDFVDPAGIAAALEALYGDRERARVLAKAGYDYVLQPQFRWSTISEQWRVLFRDMLSDSRS